MTVLKILVVLLYFCLPANSLPFEENGTQDRKATPNKYRLPNDTVPIHYNIKLNPHIIEGNFTFDGESNVYFEIRRSTSNIILNSRNLTLDEPLTKLETKDGDILHPKQQTFDDDDTEMLSLQFENPLEPGIYKLYFTFKGILADDLYGFFRAFYEDEENNTIFLAATHFQPMSARRAFPCWDEPALKATFNVSIKHYNNYTALSNMPEYAEELDESDGKVWTHFETTPIMSTNILAFAVADYKHISNSDGTMRVWTRKDALGDATYFMDVIEQATSELTQYLNSSVGVPKMDHITVPQYTSRATENWGLIVYQDSVLLHNNETDESYYKILNIMTTAHELTHQWFGNLVSPAWWKYYWLSEGMATYFKYYITDKMFKDWRSMDEFPVYTQQILLSDDRSTVAHINKDFSSSRDIKYREGAIIYGKSSAILRMVSYIVTEDVFRAGLLKYINKHKYSNVTSDDLWQALQEAWDELDASHKNVQLKEVMDTWIEQGGYPLVTVTRNYTTGETIIRQETSPTNKDKRKKEWWIPINYATKSTPNFSSTTPMHWLRPADAHLTISGIDVNDWVIINLQQNGYYRVNYDAINWRRIAEYLNSDDYTKIHAINRANIINDAFHLMTAKRLDPIIFMELINYLSREIDPIPWHTVLNIFVQLDEYLRHPEGHEILKPYLAHLMNNYIESIGFEESPGENDFSKVRRMEALKYAGAFGHLKCKEKATSKLIAYLEDPKNNKVSPDAEHWTYCVGLLQANQSTWNTLFDLRKDKLTYSSLRYFGCLEDPLIIENYLNIIVSKDSPIRKSTDPIDAVMYLNDDVPSNVDVLLDFFTKNWNRISADVPDMVEIIDTLISKISTQDQFNKLKTFLQANGINKDSRIHYREKAIEEVGRKFSKIRSWIKNEYLNHQAESIVNSTQSL